MIGLSLELEIKHCGEGGNGNYQQFLLFPQFFKHLLFLEHSNWRLCGKLLFFRSQVIYRIHYQTETFKTTADLKRLQTTK